MRIPPTDLPTGRIPVKTRIAGRVSRGEADQRTRQIFNSLIRLFVTAPRASLTLYSLWHNESVLTNCQD